MKQVTWTDKRGYKRVSLLRDNDSESNPEIGLPIKTIDVAEVDWEKVQRELHNALVDRGLLSWMDVQKNGGLRNAITSTIQQEIVRLYKYLDKE